ncbi:hypothetical protein BDQ17DRAFT_1393067 [Cyathus striatus]|nr:hypothetical protein BDQ17DRAFT_1393067 [Cyathus striatus]
MEQKLMIAENHYCSECAQRYKANADIITPDDPAAVAQVDENQNIPALTEDVRPSYVCIDKACVLLKSAATNGKWMEWRHTTRFVVDSYHYINHRVTDYICCKWCNPAPLNGSAPNLVVVEHDVNGVPHYKHAFNTQACEQLNAWIGGFQTMLNRIILSNFNWTMHTLLFLHTQRCSLVQFLFFIFSICVWWVLLL